jgi:8-oxo-dGTP pyrophosphatase MutT (NUDIX family)
VVLRDPAPGDLSVLLLRRARRPGDPWSGDWAFPGGFGHPGEREPAATARREAAEEVGLSLGPAEATLRSRWIVDPWRRRPVRLVPIVFRLDQAPELRLDPAEVASAQWVRLDALRDRRREWLWVRGRIPWWAAVRRFDGGRVWGLTGAVLDDLTRGGWADLRQG